MQPKIKAFTLRCVPIFFCFLQIFGQELPEFRTKEGSRQIHLDFHTSEALENIGSKFDKKQFQETLKAGHVNSINIFAKGHHGGSYYPTKVGKQHPNLDFDLLKAQIEACHEIGVMVQAYYTIGWSVKDAEDHPDWVFLDKNRKDRYTEEKAAANPSDPMGWGWPVLFPEVPYLDLILEQTEELVKNYDLDGIWYDIIPLGSPNYNYWSKKDMEAFNSLDIEPMVKVELPSLGRINLLHQTEHKRYVLHLLYASPIQRGSVRVIEDLVPLYNAPVTFDLDKNIKKKIYRAQ